MKIRLDKLLAHSNYGTRKEVKELIRKGFVSINDEPVFDDDIKVDTEKDEITLADAKIEYEQYRYLVLNKPEGYISATYDERYPTVLDLIPANIARGMFPVGRLDIDTTGLLLITNDGKLAHELLSPKHHVKKEYQVKYEGILVKDVVERFAKGININDEYITMPAEIRLLDNQEAIVTLEEGKYHQVKRMIKACGGEVIALKRIKFGNLILDEKIPEGEYKEIRKEEI